MTKHPDNQHPIDILMDVAQRMYPDRELDILSFAEAKLALDATMEGLDRVGPWENRDASEGED
jgi:hypothetical protein